MEHGGTSYTQSGKNFSFNIHDFIGEMGRLVISNRPDKKEALVLGVMWLGGLISPFYDESDKNQTLRVEYAALRRAVKNNDKASVILRQFRLIFKEVRYIYAIMQENNLIPPRVYYATLSFEGTKGQEYFKKLGAVGVPNDYGEDVDLEEVEEVEGVKE